jgi:hypothetical protein
VKRSSNVKRLGSLAARELNKLIQEFEVTIMIPCRAPTPGEETPPVNPNVMKAKSTLGVPSVAMDLLESKEQN